MIETMSAEIASNQPIAACVVNELSINKIGARPVVLVDVENLEIEQRKRGSTFDIGNVLNFTRRTIGVPVITRAYLKGKYLKPANLKLHRDREIEVAVVENEGKDLADKQMICDAMEILHLYEQIDTFVIVTGDKDLKCLIRMLFKYGKNIVLIGPSGATSQSMIQTIDQLNQRFYYYSEIL